MTYRVLGDVVVVVHALFVVFVVAGGLLVLRRRTLAWVHLPAAAWGVAVELAGWECPLTPLENHLRALAGDVGYAGSFVDRYLLPVLYPEELTRTMQLALGAGVLLINLAVYGWIMRGAWAPATARPGLDGRKGFGLRL